MEFRIAKTEFLRGLRLAQGIADRKSTMPMLANVLLRTHGRGKTNLLEAIFVIAPLRSFRTSEVVGPDRVRPGACAARCAGLEGDLVRVYEVELHNVLPRCRPVATFVIDAMPQRPRSPGDSQVEMKELIQ